MRSEATNGRLLVILLGGMLLSLRSSLRSSHPLTYLLLAMIFFCLYCAIFLSFSSLTLLSSSVILDLAASSSAAALRASSCSDWRCAK